MFSKLTRLLGCKDKPSPTTPTFSVDTFEVGVYRNYDGKFYIKQEATELVWCTYWIHGAYGIPQYSFLNLNTYSRAYYEVRKVLFDCESKAIDQALKCEQRLKDLAEDQRKALEAETLRLEERKRREAFVDVKVWR